MPTPKRWASPSDHMFASFPSNENLPESARPAVEAFLNMRVRVAEAGDAVQDAVRALATLREKDKADLIQHVIDGGSAATFDTTKTRAAQAAIDHARADAEILEKQLGPLYMAAFNAVEAAAAEGTPAADTATLAAHTIYTAAIEATERARRDYLEAVGLRFFWAHLADGHQAMATAGLSDQLILNDGPITRVDDAVFSALRADAQAHTRIDGTSSVRSTW